MTPHQIHIHTGYCPGAIGRIAELHGRYYHTHWNFGLFFEAKVATELAAFLKRYDKRRDCLWTVDCKGRVEGSLVIDGHDADRSGAHLRWFILSDTLRGSGLGRTLIQRAVDFCRQCGSPTIFLWTFKGLEAARHLYESAGFRLVEQREGDQWGTAVTEQRFEWHP